LAGRSRLTSGWRHDIEPRTD